VSGTIVSPHLRHLAQSDRGRIAAITRSVGLFREDEVTIALEVFDEAVGGASTNTYSVLGAELDGLVVGWICWGPTPCTLNTYDLYWMAVDPGHHGNGIGTALLLEMERRLAEVARLIVIETAGRPEYTATRGFYQARGYTRVSIIPDFYGPGDDQVVFVKYLSGDRSVGHSERSESLPRAARGESAGLPVDIGART
jgi:ribosomal protein S18 acetylase RimI-like enzyme